MEILESYNKKFQSIQDELYNQRTVIKQLSDKINPGAASQVFQSNPTQT